MKITFFVSGLSGGGTERVVCNLANYLVDRGNSVDIITIGDDEDYNLDKRIKRIKLLKKSNKVNTVVDNLHRLVRLVRYLIVHQERDVYITMLPIPILTLLNLRWLTRAKIIASERAYPEAESDNVKKKLKKNASKADAWVFQTEESQSWYENVLSGTRAVVIPNAINEEFVHPLYKGERIPTIITAGRMYAQKNQLLLIRSFQKILQWYPETRLVIYGDGPKRVELEDVIKQLGLEDKVSCPGFDTAWAVKSKDASMFVLSSDFEGIPNALMEAMALGLPCISTDCDGGGAKFLIENEKNGLLIPKGNVEALSGAIIKMLSDKEFAEQCGREANKICERLAPEKIYGEWEQFIKEIVKCD